jgi:hypothetical protein
MSDMSENEDNGPLAGQLDPLRRSYARAGGGSPPHDIDAAILAHGRAALQPETRRRRWWIPASVAATALIAFSLVTRLQQETAPYPVELDVGTAQQPQLRSADVDEVAAPTEQAETLVASHDEPAPPPEPSEAPPKKMLPARGSMPRMTPEPAQESMAVAPSAAVPATKQAASTPELEAPDDWLARIQALEAAGYLEEAGRQRQLLEAAYPGWLADHAAPH